MNCYICQKECDIKEDTGGLDSYFVKCQTCGKYNISRTLSASNFRDSISNMYILSGVIRKKTEEGFLTELLDENHIIQLMDSASVPQNPFESIDRLLLYLLNEQRPANEFVTLNLDFDYSLIFSKNGEEFGFYLDKAEEMNFIEREDFGKGPTAECRLSPRGWERVFELKKRRPAANQAFVAMWFDKSLDDAWENGFKKALKSTSYDPIRVDLVEHNEKICDKIIAEIRKSALVVADFTGNRGGVYYEAGFARGLDIPVIWTCKKGHEESLHFDTRQYNHIMWETTEELYLALKNRIEATMVI